MKKTQLLLILLAVATLTTQAQVGIGTSTPDPSAQLDITSNSKGLLIPRMTGTDRDNISSPADGLLVYQTDFPSGLYLFTNSAWTIVGFGGINPGLQFGNTPFWNGTAWEPNSNNIYNDGNRIGIGTTNPFVKLDIVGTVRIADGSEGPNRVLTSDGAGVASWRPMSVGTSGYVLIGDVASGISTAVGGNIIFATKSNAGSSSTITVYFADQGNTNFVPMISLQSLGTADDDNDVETPVILNVTSTSFDIFLNETNGTTQDLRINILLMPF